MGYGYTPYRVPVERIEALRAAPDPAEVDRVLAALAEPIREHDEWFEGELASGHPGLADAIRQLVAGEMRDDCGYAYAYALEQLCGYYGEALENTYSGPDDEFDAVLRKYGVSGPLIGDFNLFDPPIPLPPPDDFPGCVALASGACAEAADAYRAVLPHFHESHQFLAREWIGWFTACAEADQTLVVYFY